MTQTQTRDVIRKAATNTVEQGCKGKSLNFNQIYFNRVNSIRAMKGILRVLIFILCVIINLIFLDTAYSLV